LSLTVNQPISGQNFTIPQGVALNTRFDVPAGAALACISVVIDGTEVTPTADSDAYTEVGNLGLPSCLSGEPFPSLQPTPPADSDANEVEAPSPSQPEDQPSISPTRENEEQAKEQQPRITQVEQFPPQPLCQTGEIALCPMCVPGTPPEQCRCACQTFN
jgi:hypothetical protein